MILHICKLIKENAEADMNGTGDEMFLFFANNELLYYYESGKENDNLPVTLYAYIRLDMGHQFILNIIFSLGIFETEVYLTMHRTLHNALRYAKLIGTNNDKDSLKLYSRSFLRCLLKNNLCISHKTQIYSEYYPLIGYI